MNLWDSIMSVTAVFDKLFTRMMCASLLFIKFPARSLLFLLLVATEGRGLKTRRHEKVGLLLRMDRGAERHHPWDPEDAWRVLSLGDSTLGTLCGHLLLPKELLLEEHLLLNHHLLIQILLLLRSERRGTLHSCEGSTLHHGETAVWETSESRHSLMNWLLLLLLLLNRSSLDWSRLCDIWLLTLRLLNWGGVVDLGRAGFLSLRCSDSLSKEILIFLFIFLLLFLAGLNGSLLLGNNHGLSLNGLWLSDWVLMSSGGSGLLLLVDELLIAADKNGYVGFLLAGNG